MSQWGMYRYFVHLPLPPRQRFDCVHTS
jgi:hypothetical protein